MIHDTVGHTLTVWCDEPSKESICEETAEEDTPLSNSSGRLPIAWKTHELVSLVSDKTRDLLSGDRIPAVLRVCDEYDGLLRKYAHCALKDAKVFEVGFGTQAGIMTVLVSLGVDAYGVDLDAPVLRGTWRELAEAYRKNGLERVMKSFIRFYAFDWVWRRRLRHEFKRRGRNLLMPEGRLFVCDAASVNWPDESLDLICSESVFEHIPIPSLEPLLAKMARWLKPSGRALIRLDIFTGISGGHLLEWFDRREHRRRRSEPWEHLRKRRFHGNVYLNELTRADYRRMFSQHFEILEENVVDPDQGRRFYTPEVAADLKKYGEDEALQQRRPIRPPGGAIYDLRTSEVLAVASLLSITRS